MYSMGKIQVICVYLCIFHWIWKEKL